MRPRLPLRSSGFSEEEDRNTARGLQYPRRASNQEMQHEPARERERERKIPDHPEPAEPPANERGTSDKQHGERGVGEEKEMRLKLRRLEPQWPPDMRETRTQIVAGGR